MIGVAAGAVGCGALRRAWWIVFVGLRDGKF